MKARSYKIHGSSYTLVAMIVDKLTHSKKDATFSFVHPLKIESELHLLNSTTIQDAIQAIEELQADTLHLKEIVQRAYHETTRGMEPLPSFIEYAPKITISPSLK